MPETVAARLFAKFGGQTNLARALDINQSTVSHWAKTGGCLPGGTRRSSKLLLNEGLASPPAIWSARRP
jgi:hypothetical protein